MKLDANMLVDMVLDTKEANPRELEAGKAVGAVIDAR